MGTLNVVFLRITNGCQVYQVLENQETTVGLTARSLLMFSSFSGSLDLIHVHVHSLAALHHPSVHHRLHQGDDLCDHC